MKRKIISLILVVTTLLCSSSVFAGVGFSDVANAHWASNYIMTIQDYNVINGYEDGSFRPENQVKTGEFIKMVTMALWPKYNYEAPENGEHWAMPYVNSLDMVILLKNEYNAERLERVITRKEAARLIALLYANLHGQDKLDGVEEYIQNFTDADSITEPVYRLAIDECVKFGLINGFEDGSFRAEESLTRAQAAKILCLTILAN